MPEGGLDNCGLPADEDNEDEADDVDYETVTNLTTVPPALPPRNPGSASASQQGSIGNSGSAPQSELGSIGLSGSDAGSNNFPGSPTSSQLGITLNPNGPSLNGGRNINNGSHSSQISGAKNSNGNPPKRLPRYPIGAPFGGRALEEGTTVYKGGASRDVMDLTSSSDIVRTDPDGSDPHDPRDRHRDHRGSGILDGVDSYHRHISAGHLASTDPPREMAPPPPTSQPQAEEEDDYMVPIGSPGGAPPPTDYRSTPPGGNSNSTDYRSPPPGGAFHPTDYRSIPPGGASHPTDYRSTPPGVASHPTDYKSTPPGGASNPTEYGQTHVFDAEAYTRTNQTDHTVDPVAAMQAKKGITELMDIYL